MLRIYTTSGTHLNCSITDGLSDRTGFENAIWYDLINPTREEEHFVESCLGILVPTRDEMKDIEPSARLYSEANAEFMTLTVLTNLHEHDPIKTPVPIVLTDKTLVTI
ncbi:MAG: CorA, partial [Devosia sp.]|nr:CorA [Devosia sp.]